MTDYIDPDEYERNREYYDHKAAENRRRIIDNAANQL